MYHQEEALWVAVMPTPLLCHFKCHFLVFAFQAGILIRSMGRYTTATAEGPRFGVHSVTVYKQSKQKLTLTHAILLCHFMAVLCFPPSYLLLLITSFFLPSIVNKIQSNLLSKCGFLSPLVSRDCWQLWVCGLMGKKWSRKKKQANGRCLDPGLGDLCARKPGLLITVWCLQGKPGCQL